MTLTVYPGMLVLLWLAHVLGVRLMFAVMGDDDMPRPWLVSAIAGTIGIAVGVALA